MTAQQDDPIETAYRALSGALYAHDGAAALAALRPLIVPLLSDLPQRAGEAVLLGLAQGVPGAADAAGQARDALHARDAEGDDDLALEIDAALGLGPSPELRSLPVDLDELSFALEGDPNLTGGKLDLRTGEVHLISPMFGEDDEFQAGGADEDGDEFDTDRAHNGDELDGDGEGPRERWLWFDSLGSRAGFADMEEFLATVSDDTLAYRLERALRGRGPFRRFKDELADVPGELRRFVRFADDRRLGRARAWLAGNGLRPPVPAKPDRPT